MTDTIVKKTFFDKQNLCEKLVSFIKQQILEGELNPGDRIVETTLAKELGISQTPVREAIRQLSGEGIVTIVPNKGPYVRSINKKDAYEIYSLRAVLEGLAIRIVTQHVDVEEIRKLEQFYNKMKQKLADDSVKSLVADSRHIHETIVNLSNHSRLITTYKSISFQISLANKFLGEESTKQKEIEQHLELIEALLEKDPDHAEEVMRYHIYRSYNEFVDLKEVDQTENSQKDGQLWF